MILAVLRFSFRAGPHAQRVTRSWGVTADLRAQRFRALGYAVFKLDNRGSARRGLAFEGALRHRMGSVMPARVSRATYEL